MIFHLINYNYYIMLPTIVFFLSLAVSMVTVRIVINSKNGYDTVDAVWVYIITPALWTWLFYLLH